MHTFERKKVYMKKIGVFSGYKVYYVNGYWIRNHIDRDFPNYGVNRNFVFIPGDEIWIDYENGGKKEARFYIDMFLAMEKAHSEGKTHERAVEIANKVEMREREKSKIVARWKKIAVNDKILKKIHKKRIMAKYTNQLKIWMVRGDVVRDFFDVDFTAGGHEKVYPFVPQDEIWIDDDMYKKEIPYVLIHELHERYLMFNGWPYESLGGQKIFKRAKDAGDKKSAHFAAEDLEFWTRKHPKSTQRILMREIKKNEKNSEKMTRGNQFLGK